MEDDGSIIPILDNDESKMHMNKVPKEIEKFDQKY